MTVIRNPCSLEVLPFTKIDAFEIIDDKAIKIAAPLKKVQIEIMVDDTPQKNSVFVPFVNGRPIIMHSVLSPPISGQYVPNQPPFTVGFFFKYDELAKNDILQFAQYEALDTEIEDLGLHSGHVYVGKPGPQIESNVMALTIVNVSHEHKSSL